MMLRNVGVVARIDCTRADASTITVHGRVDRANEKIRLCVADDDMGAQRRTRRTTSAVPAPHF